MGIEPGVGVQAVIIGLMVQRPQLPAQGIAGETLGVPETPGAAHVQVPLAVVQIDETGGGQYA